MSVGSQVTNAMKKLSERSFEDAIVAASVALSATARLEYPSDGDKAACRKFLEQNLPIISKIGWVAFGVSQPINFQYRRLDSKAPGISVRTMPEMLYDVVRCTAVHEAKLPDNLRFTELPLIQTGLDGELVLPIDVIYGLLLAIIGSTHNVVLTEILRFHLEVKVYGSMNCGGSVRKLPRSSESLPNKCIKSDALSRAPYAQR